MAYRKYLLFLIISLVALVAKAQVGDVARADSASYALYQEANWKQLIAYGDQALKEGIDFPLLRLRIAYAQFVSGNFGAALEQYEHVVISDPHNQTARYYGYLCNKYLNRDVLASNYAGYLDSATLSPVKLNKFGLISLGAENTFKLAANSFRGNGSFTRAYLANRLGWRLQAEQSIAYYNQPIYFVQRGNDPKPPIAFSNDQQAEYYAKLSYALTEKWVLVGAYHYLSTNFRQATYHSNLGLLGLKYAGKYTTFQADLNMGSIIGSHVNQYNGRLGIYPLGNLNLYFISALSAQQQNSAGNVIFNQSLGFKAASNFWLETSATFGTLDNYLDADELYVYNALDITKFRSGATAFYQLGTHLLLQLNYTFEKKTVNDQNIDYTQHSITAGLQWKF